MLASFEERLGYGTFAECWSVDRGRRRPRRRVEERRREPVAPRGGRAPRGCRCPRRRHRGRLEPLADAELPARAGGARSAALRAAHIRGSDRAPSSSIRPASALSLPSGPPSGEISRAPRADRGDVLAAVGCRPVHGPALRRSRRFAHHDFVAGTGEPVGTRRVRVFQSIEDTRLDRCTRCDSERYGERRHAQEPGRSGSTRRDLTTACSVRGPMA